MKILILENDAELDPIYPFAKYVDKLKREGHELKYIFNAYGSADQIIAQINWPDVLAFTTTFVYIHPIYELAQAIAKYRKKPLEMRIMADGVERAIEWMIEKYAMVPVYDGPDPKNRGGQYEYTWHLDQDKAEQFGHMFRHIDIQRLDFSRDGEATPVRTLFALGSTWQLKLDQDKDFLASRTLDNPQALTGRMIRIRPGILESVCGEEWSKLKPGMIVPELSMLGASERVQGKQQDRGAWVMGKTEPVKILNDYPGSGRKFDEFEYVIETIEDLCHEIMKMCNKTSTKDYLLIQGALKNTEMSAHWKATEILDAFGLPRRQNRQVLEQRIQELENKFPEFKEVA